MYSKEIQEATLPRVKKILGQDNLTREDLALAIVLLKKLDEAMLIDEAHPDLD